MPADVLFGDQAPAAGQANQTSTLGSTPQEAARNEPRMPSQAPDQLQKYRNLAKQYEAAQLPFIPDWFNNALFYVGKQWYRYTAPQPGVAMIEPFGPWKSGKKDETWRVTRNYCDNFVQTLVGRYLKDDPIITVAPASEEAEDEDAARLGRDVLEWWWSEKDMPTVLRELLTSIFVFGTAFLKIYVRPKGKRTVPASAHGYTPETLPQNLQMDEAGNINVDDNEIFADVLLPIEVMPDPSCDSPDFGRLQRAIVKRAFPVEDVQRWYGVKDLEADAGILGSPTLAVLSGFTGWNMAMADTKMIMVYEYWERPNADLQNGRFAVWTEKQMLVKEQDLPYQLRDIFLVKFDDHIVPKRFWGKAAFNDLRETQQDYNYKLTLRDAALKKYGIGKWFHFRGSLENKEGITDEILQTLVGKMGYPPPQILTPPALPELDIDLKRCVEDMQVEMGVFDLAARSQPPGSVTAFRALSLISEQDDARLGPAVRSVRRGLSRMGKLVLNLVQEFFTLPQDLKIMDEANAPRVLKNFKGEDLRNNTEVRIQIGTGAGMNKTTQVSLLLEMAQAGLLDPQNPDHSELVWRVFELGAPRDEFDPMTKWRNAARNDIQNIMSGVMVVPHLYENHKVAVQEALLYLASMRQKLTNAQITALEGYIAEHNKRDVELKTMELLDQNAALAKLGQFAPQPNAAPGNGKAKPALRNAQKEGVE